MTRCQVARLHQEVGDGGQLIGCLDGRGVAVSEVQDFPWGRFMYFADPDGNRWAVQQLVN